MDIQNDAISAAGDTFFPKPHMFVCFFQNFQGSHIYYVYIYTCTFQLLLPDLYPFNCVLLNFNPQPPRDPYIRLPTSARRPSRAERFTLAASSLGTIKRWKPANGWGFFPPTQIEKKMLFKLKHMSSCLFPFLKVRVFCVFFFVFWRIPLKAPVPFEAYEAFFFKKGSFHRGQIFQ